MTLTILTGWPAGIIRDEEFLVAGDISGAIWVWEINYESLQPAGKLCLSPDGGDERSDEVSAILFCEALYLNRTSEEFVVAGHSSGLVHVRSFHRAVSQELLADFVRSPPGLELRQESRDQLVQSP